MLTYEKIKKRCNIISTTLVTMVSSHFS
jgi:hypothetical protein